MNTVLVCPAWNEEPAVAAVVESARAAGFTIIVVDDGSDDATARVAAAAGATVVRHPVNLGVGAALQTGFRIALRIGADCVVQVDADGQHDVGQVGVLTAAVDDSTQLVIGSRFLDGPRPGGARGLAMRTLARRASKITGVDITDASSGFRAISGALLVAFADRFPSNYLGDTFGAMLLASRMGFGVAEVPVVMADRQHGRSSAGSFIASLLVLRAVASSLTEETRRRS
jgi:glycosyltransferase involved in cell wall biosynthesis